MLQPTPENQPNSKVYKRKLSREELTEAFGYEDSITVNLKRKQRFGKSFNWGETKLRMIRAIITFSSSGKKLTVAGDFEIEDGDDYY